MTLFRIFLSAVSSEFTSVRDAVFKALEKRGFEVTYQEKLTQRLDADRTLDKVYAYFQECDLIIYIVGQRSGDFPPMKAAEPYAHLLPEGWTRASYTQWEYFFSNAPRPDGKPRHRLFYFAADLFRPEQPAGKGEDSASQAKFLDHLKRTEGQDRDAFTSEHHLLSLLKDQPWFQKALPHQPNNLPYPSLGILFVGREAFMQQLRASIETHAQAVIKPRHAIHGLGGIGKTRLATEYAWQHKEQYSALLFVIAETPEALRRNLAALCGPLVLDLPEQNANEEERKVASALAWLQQHEGWFLLVDNVDTPEAVAEAERLLGHLSKGHVVYTSRITNWAGHVEPLELDVLDKAVSVRFIMDRTAHRRRKQPNDEEQAALIAQDVDGLALALEQTCAYINAQRLTLEGYRTLWQEKHAEVLAWYDPAVMNYPKSVAITWQTSMDQLSADAKQLLMRLAWLSPEPIPESLLDVKAGDDDTLDARTALAELEKYSLVSRSHEGPFFSMHRLVQDVLRSHQYQNDTGIHLAKATIWFCEVLGIDPQDVQAQHRLRDCYPHALSICQWGEPMDTSTAVLFLMTQVSGYMLYYTSDYLGAVALLQRTLALCQQRHGLNDPNALRILNNLAQAHKRSGDLEAAERLLRDTIDQVVLAVGPEDEMLTALYTNLGSLLVDRSDNVNAIQFQRKALVSAERFAQRNPDQVPLCKHNLAEALALDGQFQEAQRLAQEALADVEARKGPDHLHVAEILNCLARTLPEDNPQVEEHLRRALMIRRKAYPPGHPDLAVALNNLGELLMLRGNSGEAESLLKEQLGALLEVSERNRTAHPQLERALWIYGRCLEANGRSVEEAEQILKGMIHNGTNA